MYVPGLACKRGIGIVCEGGGPSVSLRRFVIVCACDIITPVYQPVRASGLPSVQNFVGVKRVPVMCAIVIVRGAVGECDLV